MKYIVKAIIDFDNEWLAEFDNNEEIIKGEALAQFNDLPVVVDIVDFNLEKLDES